MSTIAEQLAHAAQGVRANELPAAVRRAARITSPPYCAASNPAAPAPRSVIRAATPRSTLR
jgi:hypothetical protein